MILETPANSCILERLSYPIMVIPLTSGFETLITTYLLINLYISIAPVNGFTFHGKLKIPSSWYCPYVQNIIIYRRIVPRMKKAFLILLGCLIFIISVIYYASFSIPVKEKKIAGILKKYNRLYTDSMVTDRICNYTIPVKSLDYSNGTTIGQIDSIVKRSYLEHEEVEKQVTFREYIAFIATLFVRNTAFENNVQINEPPVDGSLNIYFLDQDPEKICPNFEGNCSYIGYQNTIICDARFIRTFMRDLDSISRLYDLFVLQFNKQGAYKGSTVDPSSVELVKKYMRENFLMWVLGHEIAHSILHKNEILQKKTSSLHFNFKYNSIERQADSFVTKSVSVQSPLGIRFKMLLGEFIEQEFRRLDLKKQSYNSAGIDLGVDFQISTKDSLSIVAEHSQIPMLVRALRLMNTIYSNNEHINSTGTYGVIDTTIYLMNTLYPDEHYAEMYKRVELSRAPEKQVNKTGIVLWFIAGTIIVVLLLVIFLIIKR